MSGPLNLKIVLLSLGIRQGQLADFANVPRARMNELINRGIWPRGFDRKTLRARIVSYFEQREVPTRGLFSPAGKAAQLLPEEPVILRGPKTRKAAPKIAPTTQPIDDEVAMLLRNQTLLPSTRQHFQLVADPFADPTESDDVFLNGEIRYVRESMYQAARHGGFLAVIGESGAGKTTLIEELLGRIEREDQAVICVRPYMLASEARDMVGRTLRSHHIAEAIMAAVAPMAKLPASPEKRFSQLHQALRESARAGRSHVVLIDEAHSMPMATLKHLKRFRELKDGMRPLLAVVLAGQPELGVKLSEHNPEVREVVQRIEILNLPPLQGQGLEAYLKHRFQRIGMDVGKVLSLDAFEALRVKLTPSRAMLLYPLAIANVTKAAMNSAAALKVPTVTADVVKGI